MTETSSQSELAGPSSQQATEPTEPSSQPNPSTSQGIPEPSSEKPEAMDTGALASSSAAESEDASEGSSVVEDSPFAEGGPTCSGPAEGGTGDRSGTVAGTKRKPEVGPTPPRSKTKKKRKFTPAGQTFAKLRQIICLGWCLFKATLILFSREFS